MLGEIKIMSKKPNLSFTLIVDHGACIEVCAAGGPLDGALIGYAIRFAGSWDAWKVMHPDHHCMTKVAIGVATHEEAVVAISGQS